ncbi:MAG: hypothetical protein JO159_05140 [Acidobacteria bacterium]|nr:hypothetical protein [Acidobacteriota bacterium]MBV9625449.1 hypothetical protein [Acidobacteriota bacterium]
MSEAELRKRGNQNIYVTLSGLPLIIELDWPFHRSASGADFWVLHGNVVLGNSEGLRAQVAVNLSATVREVLPSLEAEDIEGAVINALRKEVDRRQLEFLRSGKLVPVHFSSRYYDFKRKRWVFGRASDDQIRRLLELEVFWRAQLAAADTWVADPSEALYLETGSEHLLEIARQLADAGLLVLTGEWASPTESLLAQAERFEHDRRSAHRELEKKHAFEDGKKPA